MTKADLIKKFLQNRCDEEEAARVMQYLDEDPSLLDETLSKSEWDEVDTSMPVVPAIELEMRKNIASKTQRPVVRILKSALTVAAMLSGIVFGLIVLYHSTRELPVENRFASKKETTERIEKVSNNTAENKEIILADNSTISLFPGSSVEYSIVFKKRTIKLLGKAIFNVTKNVASQFVVYSGAVSTTALGTRFLVDNSEDVNKVNVKLYEGRVVVQPADTNLHIDKTFLDAGQQCFVDINTMLVKVQPIFARKLIVQKKLSPTENKKTVSSIKEADPLNFSKTPMSEVLESLQKVYNQTILFNREEISESHFTGSFSFKDSLSTILKMISVMNELKIIKEGESIKVVKSEFENNRQDYNYKPEKNTGSVYKRQPVVNINTEEILPHLESITKSRATQHMPEIIVIGKKAIMYTRISLPDLLIELQKQTKKKIHFNREELEHINFTGSIPFDEAIRTTLFMVCRSNGLSLAVKKGSYYITKQNQ
jgi:ferric-dicitrate binding protein FerR (iron transport regulator)